MYSCTCQVAQKPTLDVIDSSTDRWQFPESPDKLTDPAAIQSNAKTWCNKASMS